MQKLHLNQRERERERSSRLKHGISVIASKLQYLHSNPFSTLMFHLDCHEFATQNKRSEVSLVNSRNDEFFRVFANAKDTHPQTPPQRRGLKKLNTLTLREGALGSFPTGQSICHTAIPCHTATSCHT